eukprot:gene12764-14074_t
MLNRRKSAASDSCYTATTATDTDDKRSWLFRRFPMRYSSSGSHLTRRRTHENEATHDTSSAACSPIPNVFVQFDINAKRQYGIRQPLGEDSTKRGGSTVDIIPLIQSIPVKKCEMQQRFKIEMHRKVCKHCNFENFFYKSDTPGIPKLFRAHEDSVNESLYHDLTTPTSPRNEMRYYDSEAVYKSQSSSSKNNATAKQKIVVQMPKVTLTVVDKTETVVNKIEASNSSRTPKPTLSYTYRR